MLWRAHFWAAQCQQLLESSGGKGFLSLILFPRKREGDRARHAGAATMMGESVAEWPLCLRIVLSPLLLLWFGTRVYVLPCIGVAMQRMLRCCCRGFLRHVCCGCGLTFTDTVRFVSPARECVSRDNNRRHTTSTVATAVVGGARPAFLVPQQ